MKMLNGNEKPSEKDYVKHILSTMKMSNGSEKPSKEDYVQRIFSTMKVSNGYKKPTGGGLCKTNIGKRYILYVNVTVIEVYH
jgi:hypothetical protein